MNNTQTGAPTTIKIVHTGTQHKAEPIASLKKTGPNTYVLRPMKEHDDFGIELFAGDTIEVTDF